MTYSELIRLYLGRLEDDFLYSETTDSKVKCTIQVNYHDGEKKDTGFILTIKNDEKTTTQKTTPKTK